METKQLLDQLGGFGLAERGLISLKGKGERLTFWLIGEEPAMREQRNRERLARRSGLAVEPAPPQPLPDPLVPRSSLKNKSLGRRALLLRCIAAAESPKRIRFASSDRLDRPTSGEAGTGAGGETDKMEVIVDGSPCNGRLCSSSRSSCMEGTR